MEIKRWKKKHISKTVYDGDIHIIQNLKVYFRQVFIKVQL